MVKASEYLIENPLQKFSKDVEAKSEKYWVLHPDIAVFNENTRKTYFLNLNIATDAAIVLLMDKIIDLQKRVDDLEGKLKTV